MSRFSWKFMKSFFVTIFENLDLNQILQKLDFSQILRRISICQNFQKTSISAKIFKNLKFG